MIDPQYYQHIWDCCCDHGLLGFSLLPAKSLNIEHNAANSVIHFVDIVADLINEIEHKLQRFYSQNNSEQSNNAIWQCHCIDVAHLPLTKHQGKHLVIIAGVGGDLMIKFIEAIHQQHKDLSIDFLLCPVHHQYSLREKLITLDFNFIDEVLVEEKQRFYEILLVSTQCSKEEASHSKVPAVGSKIWQPLLDDKIGLQADVALRYLNKTLKHYQRIKQGMERNLQGQNIQQALLDKSEPLTEKHYYQFEEYLKIQTIITAYQAVLPNNTNH